MPFQNCPSSNNSLLSIQKFKIRYHTAIPSAQQSAVKSNFLVMCIRKTYHPGIRVRIGSSHTIGIKHSHALALAHAHAHSVHTSPKTVAYFYSVLSLGESIKKAERTNLDLPYPSCMGFLTHRHSRDSSSYTKPHLAKFPT